MTLFRWICRHDIQSWRCHEQGGCLRSTRFVSGERSCFPATKRILYGLGGSAGILRPLAMERESNLFVDFGGGGVISRRKCSVHADVGEKMP